MDDKIIKKVILQLGKKEVELTVEEAKKLHAALNEMFEQKVVQEHHHYPYWRWTYPYTFTSAGYYTSGVTVNPKVGPTTNPIWYNTSGSGVSYDSNSSALNLSIR